MSYLITERGAMLITVAMLRSELAAKDKRIAELEELACMDTLDKSLAIRDLEQQAKGVVKGYVSACKWALGSQYDEYVAKNRAIIYAKQLKEQGDE